MQNKNFKKFSATLLSAIFLGSCSAQNICFSKTNAPIIQQFDFSSSNHLNSNNNLYSSKPVNASNSPTVSERDSSNPTSNTTTTSGFLQFIVNVVKLPGKIYKWWCYFLGTTITFSIIYVAYKHPELIQTTKNASTIFQYTVSHPDLKQKVENLLKQSVLSYAFLQPATEILQQLASDPSSKQSAIAILQQLASNQNLEQRTRNQLDEFIDILNQN